MDLLRQSLIKIFGLQPSNPYEGCFTPPGVTKPPLVDAAFRGQTERVRELLADGADVSVRDWREYNALHWASMGGFSEIVQLLLDHGADIRETTGKSDKDGLTPLGMAAASMEKEAVRVLVAAGATIGPDDLSPYGMQGYIEMLQQIIRCVSNCP